MQLAAMDVPGSCMMTMLVSLAKTVAAKKGGIGVSEGGGGGDGGKVSGSSNRDGEGNVQERGESCSLFSSP